MHRKGNHQRTKKQPTGWEKIFANELKDMWLISKVCKQLIKLNLKKKKNNQKWAEDLNNHFSKEDIQLTNRNIKICSTSLIIRQIYSKTTVRYHFTFVRMVTIKKSTNNKCWCKEKETFVHYWWECKLMQSLHKNSMQVPQKPEDRITMWPSNSTLGYVSGKKWKQ